MKKFKEFVAEETMPFAQTEKGFIGVEDPAVRDNINSLIAGVTHCKFITPYIALERISKVLANFHIFPPKQNFMEYDHGVVAVEINQFGSTVGMTNAGEVVTDTASPYYLYFEYEINDDGTFEVFSEIVTSDELDEILSDVDSEDDEEEMNEEVKKATGGLKNTCWSGYTAVGMKMKNGKKVPNCVPVKEMHMPLDDTNKGFRAHVNRLNVNKEETENSSKDNDAHFAKQSKKMQDAINMHIRKGKSYPEAVKIAKNYVKEEQLDEISTAKTDAYLKANEKSRETLASKSGLHGSNVKRTADQDKAEKKLDSRVKSMHTALNKKYGGAKVAANEEQINELSNKTKVAYVNAASKDKAELHKQVTKDTFTKSPHHDNEASRLKDIALGHKLIASRTKGIARAKATMKEEKLNEVSKATLGSYIKKASHDVAAKSAAVRGFARDSEAHRKNNDLTNSRKSDERSDKMFKKSWNRRKGIEKAVDKLTKEDTVAEARDSFAAYQRRMSVNPEKAAKKEGSWSKQQKAKTPEKANHNIAKKLARQAVKAQQEKIDKK